MCVSTVQCACGNMCCALCVFGGAHHLIIAFLWSFAIELFYSCSFGLLHCQLYIWFDWHTSTSTKTYNISPTKPQFYSFQNQLLFQIEMHNAHSNDLNWCKHTECWNLYDSLRFNVIRYGITIYEGNELFSSHFEAVKRMTIIFVLKCMQSELVSCSQNQTL